MVRPYCWCSIFGPTVLSWWVAGIVRIWGSKRISFLPFQRFPPHLHVFLFSLCRSVCHMNPIHVAVMWSVYLVLGLSMFHLWSHGSLLMSYWHCQYLSFLLATSPTTDYIIYNFSHILKLYYLSCFLSGLLGLHQQLHTIALWASFNNLIHLTWIETLGGFAWLIMRHLHAEGIIHSHFVHTYVKYKYWIISRWQFLRRKVVIYFKTLSLLKTGNIKQIIWCLNIFSFSIGITKSHSSCLISSRELKRFTFA